MEIIQQFFSEYPELATLFYDVIKGLVFLLGFLVYKKTGNKKIMEVASNMPKYKTEQTLTVQDGQTFSNVVKQYRLNKATGLLEECGTLDVHELVQSCKEQTLNAVLERFFPQTQVDDVIVEHNGLLDDLDIAYDLQTRLDGYRERYNLDVSMSNTEVLAFMKEKAKYYEDFIAKSKEVKNEEEKKIDEESKS